MVYSYVLVLIVVSCYGSYYVISPLPKTPRGSIRVRMNGWIVLYE